MGIGTLLGLWTRAAALGGMALSLTFLLVVSWHTTPYYLGPDIVFLAAFTPLALAPPSRWSVDAAVSRRLQLDPSQHAAVPEGRRQFLGTLTVATWIGLAGLAAGGSAAALGRLLEPSRTDAADGHATLHPPSQPTAGAAGPVSTADASTGTAIGRAADVPIGGSAPFADPTTGASAVVIRSRAGVYEACSAVCTHQGCTLEYRGEVLRCPCHGAAFDPATGAVLQGPARQPLATFDVRAPGDGNLYVSS
ncbi:MAG: Rieske (2Fe-2S) domain protein [Ilumatobacteraceae bacterium]|nr:Rieske (2Fe-2S) domain protein [Ilumatobacteraceae bacterium]